MNININVYGDSVLKGVVYDEKQNKYAFTHNPNLSEALFRCGVSLNNRSRFGYTTKKARELIDFDIKKGLNCDIAIIEYGGNDCNFNWAQVSDNPYAEHFPVVSLDEFVESMRAFVMQFQNASVSPVLVTLPPINAQRYLDFIVKDGLSKENILLWLGDCECIYRWQEMYSLAVTKLAYELRIPLCDLRSEFLSDRRYLQLMCSDGIHPDIEGQNIIISAFERFFSKQL